VAAPPLSESELNFLRALKRRKVRFMVVGLSAAALQGAPVVTQDVDLWFEDLTDPRIGEALREVHAAYVADIVLTMNGLNTFAEEMSNCVEVSLGSQKVRVLGLDRILTSKRAANRAKDRLVIPVLEDVLAVANIAGKRKRSRTKPGQKRIVNEN